MDSSRRADLGPSKWLKPLDDGWRERPGKDISEILAGKAKQKAACFLARGRRWTTFWSRRRESTADRRQLEKLALAVQDATTLNCDVLEATSGLDGLGGGGKGADGVLALRCHDQRGRPLGLLGIDAGFRRAEPKNSARRIEGPELARKLPAARIRGPAALPGLPFGVPRHFWSRRKRSAAPRPA